MRKFINRHFDTTLKKVAGIFCLLAVILVGRLFVLTVVQSDKWTSAANSLSIRGIYTTSPRGNIYDRNGKLLAGSKQIFSVKMSMGNMDNDEINEVATNLIKLLEKNDDEYNNNFPIKKKNGKYYYTYDDEIKEWLKSNNLDTDATAEEALYALADKLEIDSEDRYEIQSQIQTNYNIYPPISVKDMKYTADSEKEDFLESYGLKTNLTAKESFAALRKKFEIKSSVSDKQAMKIMAVRTELKSLGYKKYMPATIAKNVSNETVMAVEEAGDKLQGVEIVSETKRYYPNKNLASHVLGYLGKISSSEEAEYEKKGYETSALVGKEGIEGVYESVLKGQDGTKIVRIDAHGNYKETLKEVEAKKGKDIYLTIDSDLQKVAEEALEKNIKACRSGSSFSSEFGTANVSSAPKAKSGAVVAIEVETGDVLAMASYPSYDPNLFAEGISSEDWADLQSSNPRDSLAAAPLYNMATMSAVQPGSTFKPITAIAALESGLDPNLTVRDGGVIKFGGRTFGCVMWNFNGGNHGYLNMYKAIQVSCNYYFWDIATNKNWASGGTMGLDSSMGIEKILDYAKQFGLGQSTGIEISETTSSVPSLESKIKGQKNMLKNDLYANAEKYFTKSVYSNSKRLEKDINTIVSWMDEDGITYSEMKEKYLPEVGVKKSQYDAITELCLYTYFNQTEWSVGDTFNISIGQGDNSYTPLQMANYIATLGNDGVRNPVNIVKSIEDEGDTKKGKTTKVDTTKEHIEQVKEGMHRVTTGSGSSISSMFSSFPWEVCAKTGTAQKEGKINPESEVDYIKSHLGSFGNMSWSEVKKEMKRLMKEYPDVYTSEDTAVRRAVINLSDGKVTSETLDQFKDTYDEFAWTVAMAPKDDPKIAVACVIPQGVTGGNAAPTVREIIGQYLKEVAPEYADGDFKIVNEVN